jgi:transposase InsO family protein
VVSACQFFDISRQSYYKSKKNGLVKLTKANQVIEFVKAKRRELPFCGGRKLQHMLHRESDQRIGRDRFFSLLSAENLLVKRRKRYVRTTNSKHFFRVYNNLLKENSPTGPNQAFVSDITYLRLADRFAYLALTTDAYSRKIVGYNLSESLAVEGALTAAKMAIKRLSAPEQLIHHSDKGIQYCCNAFIDLMKQHRIKVSMAEAGNPYENAIAERINGILKMEFCLDQQFNSLEDAKKAVREAVNAYNTRRPHQSLKYSTPQEIHSQGYEQIHNFQQKKKEAKKKKVIFN